MLTAVKVYYEEENITLEGVAPVTLKTDVIVTFVTVDHIATAGKGVPGALKGKVSLSDDFNEPLG